MDELQTLITAIKELIDIDEETLTPEMVTTILANLDQQFTLPVIDQVVNRLIQGLEEQRLTKVEARNALNSLSATLTEMIYDGAEITGNRKILVDGVLERMTGIFDRAAEKYHSYSIELPMSIDVLAGAYTPSYAHPTDAAADLYATRQQIIPAHSYGNMIKTGVKIQLPEGWLAMILPRSSMGLKTPLRLSNSVGLIDSGYRGELGIMYDNTSDEDYTINAGDRIAQLLIMPNYRFQPKIVDILGSSDRGETGFGDSGK